MLVVIVNERAMRPIENTNLFRAGRWHSFNSPKDLSIFGVSEQVNKRTWTPVPPLTLVLTCKVRAASSFLAHYSPQRQCTVPE